MFVITSECICCGACAEDCPALAISEGSSIYVIDQDLCLNCGSCQRSCPVDAVAEE